MGMTRKRMFFERIIISISIWFLILHGKECCLFAAASEANAISDQQQVEVLIVVDISGSVSEERAAIDQALELVYKWMRQEILVGDVQFVVFNEKAREVSGEEWKKTAMKGDTCVLAGIEAADQWLEENRENSNKRCIIFFSDLVVEHSDKTGCRDIRNEQKNINRIIEKWDEEVRDKTLDYLFITWEPNKTVEAYDVDEAGNTGETENDESKFWCKIGDGDKTHTLKKYNDVSGEKKELSEMVMAGEMMEHIMEVIWGVRIESDSGWIRTSEQSLYKQECYEAYILVERGRLVEEESQDAKEIYFSEENINAYRILPMETEKSYKICLNEGEKTGRYYLIYLPSINCIIYWKASERVEAGREFDVYCKVQLSEEDYRYPLLEKGIVLEVYDGKNKICSQAMKRDKDDYKCTICVEKPGDYQCQAVTGDGQKLKTKSIPVKSSENKTDSAGIGKLVYKCVNIVGLISEKVRDLGGDIR